MSYDPTPHLIRIKGGALYLPVRDRLVWFREEHPEGNIATDLVYADYDSGFYVVRAVVSVPSGGSATGYKSESDLDFPGAALEKAESGSVGRALAALGYGTQFTTEMSESDVAGAAADGGHAASTRTTAQTQAQTRTTKTEADRQSPAKEESGKPMTPAVAALTRLQQTCTKVGRTPPQTVREMNDMAREHGLVEVEEGAHPSAGWIDSIRDAVWRSVVPVTGKSNAPIAHTSHVAAYDESKS